MKLIAEDALLSIAKDVTLANGAKHRCIDATQIHELPKTEIVRCKDCKHGYPLTDSAYYACTKPFAEPNNRKPFDWFCADGERKEGEK